jgi:2,4-dienoyl-CoA reductase-like NADH-dependent reductase (Old Yellow Enzyme family)
MRDNGHVDTLFEPLALGSLALPNRLAVAPMTRVSATADGVPTARMADYYALFADGGFGLVITEGLYTDEAFSQGYLHQPGLANAAQRDAWRPIVDGVQSRGSRVITQLMHAGALSQRNPYRTSTVGPSAVRPKGRQMTFYRGAGDYAVPAAMTQHDIDTAVAGFAQAAARAREAGFDGVEIHGANGYLLDQFLSEGINLRDDRYGGGIDGCACLWKWWTRYGPRWGADSSSVCACRRRRSTILPIAGAAKRRRPRSSAPSGDWTSTMCT